MNDSLVKLVMAFVFCAVSAAAPAIAKTTRKTSQVDPLDLIELDVPAAPVATVATVAPKVSKAINDKLIAADAFEKKKEFANVVEILKPSTDELPRRGLMMLARAYNATAEISAEIRVLELSLAKSPKDYVVQSQLGDAYARAKRSDDAVSAFTGAKALNPRYRPAYEGLLNELEKGLYRDEARSLLNDMVKVFGEEPRFLTALCRLYSADGFLEKSVETCRAAISKDPNVPESHVYLGTSLRDQENSAAAWKTLSAAAKRFPASEVVQSTAAELKSASKDYAEAYHLYKVATQADAKSARAWVGLANSAFELQKNEESVNAFAKACALDRNTTKDFRAAYVKLRVRKDAAWENRFEDRLANCN